MTNKTTFKEIFKNVKIIWPILVKAGGWGARAYPEPPLLPSFSSELNLKNTRSKPGRVPCSANSWLTYPRLYCANI